MVNTSSREANRLWPPRNRGPSFIARASDQSIRHGRNKNAPPRVERVAMLVHTLQRDAVHKQVSSPALRSNRFSIGDCTTTWSVGCWGTPLMVWPGRTDPSQRGNAEGSMCSIFARWEWSARSRRARSMFRSPCRRGRTHRDIRNPCPLPNHVRSLTVLQWDELETLLRRRNLLVDPPVRREDRRRLHRGLFAS